MPSSTAERRRPTPKPSPSGFWTHLKSLKAEVRQVEKMTPRVLLSTLGREASAPTRRAAMVKEVQSLELAVQGLRRKLERSIAETKAANDDPRTSSLVDTMVASGELLDSAAFADRIGWTRQALSKALAARRVFFVEHAGARYFPAFYADARYERRQLEAVTKILGDLPGGAKLQFFLNPRGSLNRATPLQALTRGQLAAVKAAAEGFVQG